MTTTETVAAVQSLIRDAYAQGNMRGHNATVEGYWSECTEDHANEWIAENADRIEAAVSQAEPVACTVCAGTRVVQDGAMHGWEGVDFEMGPIQCVKDCPACVAQRSISVDSELVAAMRSTEADENESRKDQKQRLLWVLGEYDFSMPANAFDIIAAMMTDAVAQPDEPTTGAAKP
jgi:hypothetical protein